MELKTKQNKTKKKINETRAGSLKRSIKIHKSLGRVTK